MIEVEMRGAESLEDHRGPQLERRAHRRGQLGRAAALDQDVNFADDPGALATKKPIADVTADHEGREPQLARLLLDGGKGPLPFRKRGRVKLHGHVVRGGAQTRRRRSTRHRRPAPDERCAARVATPARTRRSWIGASAAGGAGRP